MNPVLARGVRRPRPDLLLGGEPLRSLRLSAAGVAALDAVLEGRPAPGVAALTRRLLVAEMLLLPPGPPALDELTVVVPALSSSADVRRLLAGLPPGVAVVVVDDGSDPPLDPPAAVRHDVPRGPAAARNAGARIARTRLLAFVDVDVDLPPEGWARLTGHLAQEGVVAAAPRVVASPGRGAGAVLERDLPALDLGSRAGWVRPATSLPYVPSAALVVDRDAFEAAGGFDEDLHLGEDVDLVWRLCALGRVRYDPDVVARHRCRRLLPALRRRFSYATSVGPLERRHPGRLTHLVLGLSLIHI